MGVSLSEDCTILRRLKGPEKLIPLTENQYLVHDNSQPQANGCLLSTMDMHVHVNNPWVKVVHDSRCLIFSSLNRQNLHLKVAVNFIQSDLFESS